MYIIEFKSVYACTWASLLAHLVKNPPVDAGDAKDSGSIPGLGRSPGEGNGYPLQYSCLQNPMNGGAWWTVVIQSQRVGHDWETEHAYTCMLRTVLFSEKVKILNKGFMGTVLIRTPTA